MGEDRESLKDDLIKTARKGIFELALNRAYASSARAVTFEEALKLYRSQTDPKAETVKLPWYPDKVETLPMASKERLLIFVCGDRSRNKSQTMSNWGFYQSPVIKKIKLPANWDELVKKLTK